MSAAYDKVLQEVLIDEASLKSRVAELGAQISQDYAKTRPLLMICVLKGGVMFLTDLMRHVTIPHAIDFLAVSSYGLQARQSTGAVRMDMTIKRDGEAKLILFVKYIVDRAPTLAFVVLL